MARGKPVSEDLAWTVLRMLPLYDMDTICALCNLSLRTVHSISALHRQTGNVVKPPKGKKKGRRALTAAQVDFLQGSLNRSCDLYLDELRDSLEQVCGVSVSLPTVWRSLRRSGWTMKKVSTTTNVHHVTQTNW
ncbi:hypothetical protein K439DRAFT_1337924 [Ramaria rubella]|nr:hypothetical protein K439DRAFT_1337924 [Ramaria rubella]